MNELDKILLEQLQIARHMKNKMKKAKKVMGDDSTLIELQERNEKRVEYLESMIEDKTLLHKKVKRQKKKEKDPDILARSTSYEWYRNIMIASNIGYRMMVESFQAYMSFFTNKKGKD